MTMIIYEIAWHTEPAYGCELYSGKEEFRSNSADIDEAVERFKNRKSKDMLLSPWCINVLMVVRHYRG